MELRDRHGIFSYYKRIFLEGISAPDEPVKDSLVFGYLTNLQKIYNEVAATPCRGLKFMHIPNKPDQYCRRSLCPSCWHRTQLHILKALQELRKPSYYFIRSTWDVPWNEHIHPRCVQRFKAKGSKYSMLCWSINFRAIGPEIDPEMEVCQDTTGELMFSYRGVFAAERDVRDTGVDPGLPGQSHVYEDPHNQYSDLVGVIDRVGFDDPSKVVDNWLSGLRHPWMYQRHLLFSDYIRSFEDINRWSRVNHSLVSAYT